MAHIALPIVIYKAENETYGSGLDCFNNLSEDETEIQIRGPVDLGQIQQPQLVQVHRSIHRKVRWDFGWAAEEDSHLLLYIVQKGKSWPQAACNINRVLHSGVKIRSSYSCRERWRNHLKPILSYSRHLKKRWTDEEDIMLLNLYDILGGCWRSINKHMPMISRRHSASDTADSDASSGREDEVLLKTYIE